MDLLAPDHAAVEPDVFHYQWVATERYCRELAHEGTEAAHLNGIVSAAGEAYRTRDVRVVIPALFAFVYHLENTLSLEEALDVLETIHQVGGQRLAAKDAITAQLRLGLVYRNLAAFDESDAAYAAAEELATRAGDMHSVLLSRIGRAFGLKQRGNIPESERALIAILADARAAGDDDAEARSEHALGTVLDQRGQPHESAPHLWRAYELYPDEQARVRALGDLGTVLLRIGDGESAERALRAVVERSKQVDVLLNAQVELMHACSYRRDRVSFERWRAECVARLDQMTPSITADFYLKAGVGCARFGNFRKARQLMDEGVAVAGASRIHEFEFRIERIRAGLGDCEEVAREGLQAAAEPVLQTEALKEVSASLALLGA
ncbi:MAG: hypothetical protein ACREMJ_00080 [Gemmatimonadales bacterium]